MNKVALRIIVVIGIPIIIGTVTFLFLRNFFLDPVDSYNTREVLVEVKPGSSFREFCKHLHDEGIVRHWWILDFMSQIKKTDKQIQAGEYLLSPSMSPKEIMAKLSSGDVYKRIVTIKEGMDMWDVAQTLEEAKILSAQEFLKTVTDRKLLKRMDITGQTLEGYLYPETYHFSGKRPILEVVWKLIEEFQKNWHPEYNERLKELGFSMDEIVTLASIIEKESGNVEEQPRIAGVFYNRLRNGIRLESDPTLVYGDKNYGGVVLNKHKDRESPYNTYKNFGLPPGPICNPGKTAIRAALFPMKTDDLFFVADGKGGHVFSRTLKEHNIAVRNYRKLMKEKFKDEFGSDFEQEEETLDENTTATAETGEPTPEALP